MIAAVISILTSVLATWIVAHLYYRRGTRDLRRATKILRGIVDRLPSSVAAKLAQEQRRQLTLDELQELIQEAGAIPPSMACTRPAVPTAGLQPPGVTLDLVDVPNPRFCLPARCAGGPGRSSEPDHALRLTGSLPRLSARRATNRRSKLREQPRKRRQRKV